jgi:hypothetical protein
MKKLDIKFIQAKVMKVSDRLQLLFPSGSGWKYNRKSREWESELGHAGWRAQLSVGDYDNEDVSEFWYYPKNEIPIRVY